MSEVPPELPRPEPPRTWRDRVMVLAESFDLTPARLAGSLVALVVVALVGWRLLAPPPPAAEMRLPSVTSGPPSSSATSSATSPREVVVHVAGAVAGPGIQRLGTDARVADALEAAGGAAPDADLARINLAALVEDGQQIYVPRVGEPAPTGAAAPTTPGHPGALVDVNTATAEELTELPGIGPTIAEAIVAYRTEHGPFAAVDDLLDVPGIGESKLATLRPEVTV